LSKAILARYVPTDIIWKNLAQSKTRTGFPFDCRPFRPPRLTFWSKYFDGINSCIHTFRQAKQSGRCIKGCSKKSKQFSDTGMAGQMGREKRN
jgi:hypothetical protein